MNASSSNPKAVIIVVIIVIVILLSILALLYVKRKEVHTPDINVHIAKVTFQVTDYLAERRKRKEELEFSDFRGGMVTKYFSQVFN